MNPPRPWRPSGAIQASVLLHAGAAATALALPGAWPWALAAVAADHAALTAAGLWPRSRMLGPNLLRLPDASVSRAEVGLTVDDGPDPEVTPAVLDLLARRGARASFFCIGERARAHPDIVRAIVAGGHRVENHTQRHHHGFSLLGVGGFVREIGAAQDTLASICGTPPHWFRAPAGLRNPLLEPALARLGLHLAAWTRRGFDTVRRDPQRVASRLLDGLAAGDVLLLHDGHAARTPRGVPVILEVLPRLLDALEARGLRAVALPRP